LYEKKAAMQEMWSDYTYHGDGETRVCWKSMSCLSAIFGERADSVNFIETFPICTPYPKNGVRRVSVRVVDWHVEALLLFTLDDM
jgi:hypothetical protein